MAAHAQVLAHHLRCAHAVAFAQRAQDVPHPRERRFARRGVVERQHAQIADVTGAQRNRAQQPAVGDQVVPRRVEASVRLDECVGVVVAIGGLGVAQRGRDTRQRRGIGDRARDLGERRRLEQAAQLVDFVDVHIGQHGHDEAAGVGRDQSLAFQPRERLAHGRAGDTKLQRERRFLQPLAGADHVAAKRFAERLVDLVGKAGRAIDGFEHGHHRDYREANVSCIMRTVYSLLPGVNRGTRPTVASRNCAPPMASPKLPFAPLWASPFRPFCALGMAYGIALMATWLAARAGGFDALLAGMFATYLWHGHEMLFGFAAAIICATVLTALPGWARTPEIHGVPLAALVALWLAGRVAFWAIGVLPLWVVVAADGALYVALLGILAPQLLRVSNRYYLLLLVVLAGMLVGDVLFLTGRVETGLKGAVYSVALLFALKGGVFAPVFTGNYLRATGRGPQTRFLLPLEFAAIGAILVLAALDLGGAPQRWIAAAALC